MITVLLLPGLKIRLETPSIFSVPGQLLRTYPHRQSLWTILVQRLYTTPVHGTMSQTVDMSTTRVCRMHLSVLH